MDHGFASNQIYFSYARALRKTGTAQNKKKSDDLLKKIVDGKDDDFWKKLAAEVLASEARANEG
jgi:CRISPR/Cas system Type II protein with McrA/HNH and RuvC-like nuclease domain